MEYGESMPKANKMTDQELVDEAIEQIKRDVEHGDFTAIEELLKNIPRENLANFICDTSDIEVPNDKTYFGFPPNGA